MRVLLESWGSRGDVEPMAGFADQLRAIGVEVRVCVPPDPEFAGLFAGMELVPIGQSVREIVTGAGAGAGAGVGAGAGGPGKAPQVAAALVGEWFDTVLPASEGCDALVVSGLMPAGGPSVAALRGVPYVCALFQSWTLPTPDHPPLRRPGKPFPEGADIPTMWRVDAEKADDLYAAPLNRRRAEAGLPPVTNVRDHVITDHPWVATDPFLDPPKHTPGFDAVRTGAWFRADRRPLPPELMAFLDAGTPPVYVGFGSMPLHTMPDLASEVVAALRDQGRRVVASRGWAGLTGIADATDCFVVDDVNHQTLFPRVAAVVHHGGAGTTTACARAGTPQVIVPQAADQPYWAARMSELGIGFPVSGDLPIAAALEAALAPETRSRVSGVAGSVVTDGASRAARRLVDLIELAERSEVPA